MNYEERDHKTYREDPKEGLQIMCNFTAEIVTETRFVDGINDTTSLILRGRMPHPDPEATDEEKAEGLELPEIEISGEEFAGMKWVTRRWGVRCVIYPGSGIVDDLRTHIQTSSTPQVRHVYKQTGWEVINGKRVYLHVGGGITKTGNDGSISVLLPPELTRYNLACQEEPGHCVRSVLGLVNLARPDLTWPLLAASLAPLYGPVDFAVHLTGRTGSFKSEVCSLFQSLYGAGMDARHLPGSWSSTANAIEALAFMTRSAVFCLDDFVPMGTSWQQKQYQQNADKIIRSQGNQSGRARLTDTSRLQQTMYPRGLILSTGEDTPEGHSVRARMLILELVAGEIEPGKLSQAQALRKCYPGAVAFLAQELAGHPVALAPRVEQWRDDHRDIGHSRTPGMLGRLVAVAEHFLATALGAQFITKPQHDAYRAQAERAIMEAGSRQKGYLEDADPVDIFLAALRQALGSGAGHLRTLNGGTPADAAVMGWTSEGSRARGELEVFKARGPLIGWVKPRADELYLDTTTGYSVVKKVAGAEMPLSKQTLFKRMKDSGVLLRVDEGRQRNTIRVVAENHPRQVLCLSLARALELKETEDETDDADDDDDGDDADADDDDGVATGDSDDFDFDTGADE